MSATVGYEDSYKTLLITVSGNFANGDNITISDLSFESFTSEGTDNLELEIDNSGTSIVIDDKTKTIGTRMFRGGSYDGYDSSLGANFAIGTKISGLTIKGATLH